MHFNIGGFARFALQFVASDSLVLPSNCEYQFASKMGVVFFGSCWLER